MSEQTFKMSEVDGPQPPIEEYVNTVMSELAYRETREVIIFVREALEACQRLVAARAEAAVAEANMATNMEQDLVHSIQRVSSGKLEKTDN